MGAKVGSMETTSNLPATDKQLESMTMRDLNVEVCKQVRQWFAPPDATSADIAFFVGMAQAKGLDIWNEDIHMIPFQGKAGRRYAPVTNYQIYLDRADQSGVWDGMDIQFDDEENPKRCTVTIYRKDWSRPGKRTTLLKDVMRCKKDGSPMALWATRTRQMFEKCAVVAALRFYIPACRRMPYIEAEISDSNVYQPQVQQISQAAITGAEVVNADADIDYLRGQFFKYGGSLWEDDDARHRWQEEKIHKASLTDWDIDDFRKALDLIDAEVFRKALDLVAPENDAQSVPDSEGEETPTTDEENATEGEIELDIEPEKQSKADKVKQITDMVGETPIGSVKSNGFKTWAAGILGKGASSLLDLPEADLDKLIEELNLRIDEDADNGAREPRLPM